MSFVSLAMSDAQPVASLLRGARRPEYLRTETLLDIVSETARRTPDAIALSLLGSAATLTYAELTARARRVAASLAAHGVRRGDYVGLWMSRSLDLHVGLLGILAAGATFVPFDADAPPERVAGSLADCGARVLLTHRELGNGPSHLGTDVDVLGLGMLLDDASGDRATDGAADTLDHGGPPASPEPPQPDDIAYVIYTSGSTGKPKGVSVTHRSICHYLRAGNEVLGIRGDDVVLQQASIAFDLSLEEIFVPYLVGARLAVAPSDILKQTDRLPGLIADAGVTVIDTVPTLLALLDGDLPGVRLLIVGGEACPPALVARLARPGRRLVNTYGPTEATVVATAIELVPGAPVTIGRPIANVTAYVVDAALRLVSPGETGELLLGGPGIAVGYLGLPELTAQRFIANPFRVEPTAEAGDPVLYRTGDAVSLDADGRLHFHGRIDDQVKIRGYRIELGEIEALIAADPAVAAVAVAVHAHPTAGDTLVAHVVTQAGARDRFDVEAARRALALQVPPYMVPAHWRLRESLPQVLSGKVDRKALAAEPLVVVAADVPQEPPATLTEAHLLKAARDILGLPVVDFDADFFTGLGGHSLLAALFVSEVRKTPHLSHFALQDVYTARTLRRMAAALDARAPVAPGEQPDLTFTPPPLLRRFLCGLAQAITLPFIIAIVTAQWIGLLLASIYLVREETSLWVEVLILCGVYVALNLGAKAVVIALKWLVIGRTRPGVYPLWGSYYFRLWLVQRTVHMTGHKFLQGTPLMRIYLRALGARVGRDAVIHEFEEGAIDLVSIGARTSLGQKVRFANVEVIGNEVHVGRIVIGAEAYVGNACVIGHDVSIGDRAELSDLTAIAAGTHVGADEHWDGSPGRHVGPAETAASLPPHPELSPVARALQTTGYFVTFNLVMMVGLLPIFPAFYLLSELDGYTFGDRDNVVPWEWVFLFAWPSALVLVFVSMLVVVAMRWILLPGRLQPGRHSIHSWLYFRKWAVGLSVETMLETLNSLYATVFMRHWYRMMGTRIGRGTEISANFAGRYDLITLGESNFIGDEAIFGDEDIRGGWMTLDRVSTGDRCFFGNLCVVTKGASFETDSMIGVKSKPPPSNRVLAGETWFGSPPFSVPNRQKVVLADNLTYRPPFKMRVARTIFEGLHSSLPTAVLITLAYMTADIIEFPIDRGDYGSALAVFLAAGVVVSMAMMLVSLAFKWIFAGVYRPQMRPMWSWWAMRSEAVAVLYGGLANKVMLDYVRGTPFLPWLLRLYGMRIGRGTFINCTDVTEFDCIEIGDFAVVNMHVNPQTHLYEDRIMKIGRVKIGRGVTIGTGSIVLYDTTIGDFARLMPLTVVMKGETIPAGSAWAGSPAAPAVPVAAKSSPARADEVAAAAA